MRCLSANQALNKACNLRGLVRIRKSLISRCVLPCQYRRKTEQIWTRQSPALIRWCSRTTIRPASKFCRTATHSRFILARRRDCRRRIHPLRSYKRGCATAPRTGICRNYFSKLKITTTNPACCGMTVGKSDSSVVDAACRTLFLSNRQLPRTMAQRGLCRCRNWIRPQQISPRNPSPARFAQ